MMEAKNPCREQCKYQRDGQCILEKMDFVSPVHGAVCCEHLFEDESTVHH